MKKMLFAMLCLLFLCLAMTGSAFAEDKVEVTASGKEPRKFGGLQDAIKYVTDEQWTDVTYTLLKSFGVGNAITMKNATLNMNGQYLRFQNTERFENVTIQGLGSKLIIQNGSTVTFDNCTIDLNNKCIEVQSGGKLYVTNKTLIKNGKNTTSESDSLLPSNNNMSDGKGGAIYAQAGAYVEITDSTLQNNEANYGGAIFICGNNNAKTNDALVIRNSNFIANKASTLLPRGGAIYIDRSKVKIERSTFEKNSSYNGGGAIYLTGKHLDTDYKAAQLEVLGTTFKENNSGFRGGAITVSEFSRATFLDFGGKPTEFIGNYLTAARNFAGGALFIDISYVYMENVLITENQARDAGGGISACSTGTADIRPLNGAMIHHNTVYSYEKLPQVKYYPDIYFFTKDHLNYNSTEPEHVDGRDDYSTIGMKYELYEMMFNGYLHNWEVMDFDTLKNELKFRSLIAKSSPNNTTTEVEKPKVIFTGNKAVQSSDSEIVSGGAIADNGLLEIGTTSEIRIVKVWKDENPYGITTRPPAYDPDDVYSLLDHMVLIENNRSGPGKTLGTLDMIKADNNEITVDIYTGSEAKKRSPYSSNVVHEENPVIVGKDGIYKNKEWNLPDETYWLIDVKGLPGNPYGYTIEENTILGYHLDRDKTKGMVLTNILETTNLNVRKEWVDPGHSDKRPGSVTIRLYADGVEVAHRQLRGPSWETEFVNLPRYQEGKSDPIEYTVTEDRVKDYTSAPSGDEALKIIQNTYNPGKTTVYVTKRWEDAHNQDGKRPSSVKVHLFRDGKDTGNELILSEENNWTGTFNNLDENGTYSVREDSVSEYEISISGNQNNGFVITNSHESQLIELEAKKVWNDGDNPQARPAQVTFRLHANGIVRRTRTVNAANDWSVTFDRLPKYEGGKEIEYTITEDHVHNYTTDINSLEVVNTYNPGKTDVYVVKAWEDDDDLFKIRPEQVTVHLYANGVNTGKQLTLNEKNHWYGYFGKLDELDANKEKIEYTVVEDPVEGYLSFVTGNAEKGYTIGNALIPEDDKQFRFTKVWIGGTGNEISWTFYSKEGKHLNQRFNRKKLSDTQWLYESANNVDRGDYLIENPIPGYVIQYENVGAYANVTDRLYNGGRILNIRLPQTGDKDKLWAFMSLGALSILGTILLLKRNRKRRTET